MKTCVFRNALGSSNSKIAGIELKRRECSARLYTECSSLHWSMPDAHSSEARIMAMAVTPGGPMNMLVDLQREIRRHRSLQVYAA